MDVQTNVLDVGCNDIGCGDTNLQQLLNHLYDYENDLPTKVYHRSRIALFQILLAQLIAQGFLPHRNSALDIGCNAGFYSKLISDCGFPEVLGIDINAAYVTKANGAFRSDQPGKRVTFQVIDATAMSLAARYDFILCTEVIEHTDEPERVILSIMNLLAPGGVALLSLPNSLSIGYSSAYLAARLKRRGISPELRDHLKFPFYKAPGLFKRFGAQILMSAGVNCFFNDRVLLLLARTPLLDPLNRLNFWLSCRWPLKYIAQFYFFAIRRP